MKLRVSGGFPIVVAHRLRLPGEEFEVPDKLGVSLLEQSGVVDRIPDPDVVTATMGAPAQPGRRSRRRAKQESGGAE